MNCKIENCGKPAAGKSKYCREHRAESRTRFKEMIVQKAAEKEQREADFASLWEKACEAGRNAAEAAKPQMITAVDERTGETFEPFPVCGFAQVTVRPGNCAFANWLKKNSLGKTNSYSGGVYIWISDYNQSYDLKLAYARGMAKVLQEAGIKATAVGRLD
jgi:hypothetical protein